MSLLGKIFVKLGLDNSEFKRGMNESKQEGNKFADTFKQIGARLAAAFAIERIIAFGKEMVSLRAKVAGVEDAFKKLNRPTLLKELRAATSGTVDDLTLMSRAVMANNFRIPLEQLGNLFAFASKRARETGENVDFLVDSIVKGIARQSIMILDNLGLSLVEIRQNMEDGSTMAEAVGKIIQKEMGEGNKVLRETISLTDQIAASWKNMSARLAKSPVGGFFSNIGLMIKQQMDAIAYLFGGKTEAQKGIMSGYEQEKVNKIMSTIKTIGDAEAKLAEVRRLMGLQMITSDKKLLEATLIKFIADKKAADLEEQRRNKSLGGIQEQIDELSALREKEIDPAKIRYYNEEISLLTKKLETLQLTTAELKKQGELRRLYKDPLTVPAGGRQLYDGLTALYGLGGQQTEADLMANAKKTMDGVAKKSQEADWANRLAEMLKNSNDQLQIEADRTEQIAGQISNAFSNIIGASVENLSDIISGTSKLDSSQLAAALLMPLADMAIAIGTIILTSGEAIQGLMKALTNPANAGVAVAAGLGLIAVGILAKAGLKALAKNGGQAGQGSTTSFTGGAGGFAPSVSQTKVEVFGKISGNDILLSSTRANIDKRR